MRPVVENKKTFQCKWACSASVGSSEERPRRSGRWLTTNTTWSKNDVVPTGRNTWHTDGPCTGVQRPRIYVSLLRKS